MTKYEVVLEALSQRIDGMDAGAALPTESSLAREFEVSPMTVRRALQILNDAGRVVGVRGKGTFVSHAPVTRGMQLASFSQLMLSQGRRASTRVLAVAMEPSDARTAEAFGIETGAQVYRLRRLRLGDGIPFVLEDTILPAATAPGLLGHDLSGSLYDILRSRYGLAITAATTHIGAVVPASDVLDALALPPGAPCLRVRAAGRHEGTVIERTTSLYRADMYEIAVELVDDAAEPATVTR